MSDWKTTGKTRYDAVEKVTETLTGGLVEAPKITEVRNTETGEVREVLKYKDQDLGSRIADGKFVKKS